LLQQRRDDEVATIKKRLEVYEKTVKDLLDYYNDSGILKEVSGDMEVKGTFPLFKRLL